MPSTGSLSQIANYLTAGFWDDTGRARRRFNLEDSGSYAKSGVIKYHLDKYYNPVLKQYDGDGLAEARKPLVRQAFEYIGNVTGINFVETDDWSKSDIDFGDAYSGAYAHSPLFGETIKYSTINMASWWYDAYGENYYYQTVIHEIGHALGLGHSGNYNASNNTHPAGCGCAGCCASEEASSNSYWGSREFDNDSWAHSIMSYFSPVNPNVEASPFLYKVLWHQIYMR